MISQVKDFNKKYYGIHTPSFVKENGHIFLDLCYHKDKPKSNLLKVSYICKCGKHKCITLKSYIKSAEKGNTCYCNSLERMRGLSEKSMNYLQELGLELFHREPKCKQFYVKDNENYIFKTSVDLLKKSIIKYNKISYERFNCNNKYLLHNFQNYCIVNRPNYLPLKIQIINNRLEGSLCYIKYLGEDIPKSSSRYFKTEFRNFIRDNTGHPIFTMSGGELKVKEFLSSQGYFFKFNFRFKDCKDKQPLPFDFAVFNKNKILLCLIEFDGKQHYKEIKFFNMSLEERIKKDIIKNNYCIENNIPLIRIPYTDFKDINTILLNKIPLK